MTNGFFVTGTDTGVGKTVVATILARGLAANYWKPVQTGSMDGRDSDFAGQWIGSGRVFPEAFLLNDPLSPHAAARNEGVRVSLAAILAARPLGGITIVEGAGGALVPLNESEFMVGLMSALNLPVIVVARSELGTINHTLLTLEALRAREISAKGVILVGPPNRGNRDAIRGIWKNTGPGGDRHSCRIFAWLV